MFILDESSRKMKEYCYTFMVFYDFLGKNKTKQNKTKSSYVKEIYLCNVYVVCGAK